MRPTARHMTVLIPTDVPITNAPEKLITVRSALRVGSWLLILLVSYGAALLHFLAPERT